MNNKRVNLTSVEIRSLLLETLGYVDGDIDSEGKNFKMYGYQGNQADLYRLAEGLAIKQNLIPDKVKVTSSAWGGSLYNLIERPDFSEWKCKICDEPIEDGYFWYYLRHRFNNEKSLAVCSKECLDKLIKSQNCSYYEIYEYSRCSAYYKCEEIGNLRGICETVENKTYQSIIPLISVNHCQPAQAGTILSTHKLTHVLEEFSKQTEKQYLSNKEMMEKGAEESSNQFKITTWMSVLIILLTIVNMVPAFINWGTDDYSEQLNNIEARISEINSEEELNNINNKLQEITMFLNDTESANIDDSKADEIIRLLESIESQLNSEEVQ